MVERRDINPWSWQDQYGFSQAIEVRGSERVVYCAGQTSVDDEGAPLHPGDMAKQVHQALDNLEAVLADAGLTLGHLIRLNYYVTDMGAFMEAAESLGPRMGEAGCKPASTLLEVKGLFHPDLVVEIEATAAA
jgi:enamine deaminase RidA (YjgF/YER057c/UK114 family)